jgi:hypothetical protein
VNGYEARQLSAAPMKSDFPKLADASNEELGGGAMAGFHFGEMKFPKSKIGEASVKIGTPETTPAAPPPIAPQIKPPPSAPAPPPRIPVPPPIRAGVNVLFGRR